MNALTNHVGKKEGCEPQKKITRLFVVCASILLARARVLLAQTKKNLVIFFGARTLPFFPTCLVSAFIDRAKIVLA